MGNMCCRREVFAPNAADTDPSRFGHHHQTQHQLGPEHHPQKPHQSQQQRPVMSSAYHPAGDDCAINELLEGRMDLDVLMPDGRQVRLTVERRTPMMDLLVQAASATKISPGGHVIQVFGDGDKSNGTLPYKPSTPIGSLDTNTIYVVSKKDAAVDPQFRRNGKTAHRPFEPTFRVQVHLPRNQLTVLRVSPKVKIAELKTMVCKEKGLDTSRYQLVRPSGPTQPLSGDITLSEYGSTEITLLSNSSIESNICNSTSHIMPYPKRTEEHKRKTGILRLLAEDANHKNANFNSTHQIDGNQRKVKSKTVDINVHQHRFKPKKRRPAPPPPPPVLPEAPSHSRQSSSDSSGYHEATSSFLHEEHSGEEKASSDSSGVSSMDAKGPSIQQQTTPPIPNSKKKKAPAPPPPPSRKEKEIRKETIVLQDQTFNEDVAAQKDSVIYKDIILDKQLHIQVLNPVTETDSISKINFTEKDLTAQQNFTDNNSIPHNDSSALTGQIVQTVLTSEAIEVTKKSPVLDDIIVDNNSAPDKNLPTHETTVVLNNDLNLKDHATKQDPLSQKDQNPSTDSVILPDQMALVDPVLKQEGKSEKILNLQIQDNENKMLQLQTAVASEDITVPNDETDLNEEKEVKCNTLIEVKQRTSASIPLSLNAEKYSSSEKKVEKNKLASKSEAVSTRVALVALNARIEQDVTQKEIASSIQAAFHSLDCSPHQPSLLAIKQRNRENPRSNSSQYSNGSSESHETLPLKKASVTLNSKSCSKVVKESLSETSTRFSAFEKEALFIDDEPPPRPASATPVSTTNLKRASSLLNFTDAVVPRNVSCKNTKRVRHLQRSLSDLSVEDKEDFEAEQERLQQEYIKLQRQFIIWQQQLMNNHAMLREECLVPQYARTLRQSHSLPEGEDYSDETTPSAPLVSRSLSYEPTKERCSTLPRSTINIPSLEFGTLQINNGTTTLRSSKTKSYFKPPQVRVSTKSRQRIPPEIKKEGDVDITDDTKMLTTILPSFESLKLISENSEEDIHLSVSRLKDTMSSTKSYPLISQGRKVPQVHLSSTFSKLNSKLNNGDRIADTDLKCVNGDTGQSKLPVNGSKITEPSSNAQLPPPPPPTPIGVTKVTAKENCTKATGHTTKENCTKATGQKNGVGRKEVTPCVDSRDQLMQEIRKFGGRTALRKISLAS